MIKDENTYAILAPTSSDNNINSIAVRTIICKKSNGLIQSYLLPDQVITQKAPFDGEFYLFDVDIVTSISVSDRQLSTLNGQEIIRILKDDGAIEFLKYNKTWASINSYYSGVKNEKLIVRNIASKQSTSLWAKLKKIILKNQKTFFEN